MFQVFAKVSPVGLHEFVEVVAVNVLVDVLGGAVDVLSEAARVPPGLVVHIVRLVVAVARVHALAGVEEALVVLRLVVGRTARRQTQRDLLADVALALTLQLAPLVGRRPGNVALARPVLVPLVAHLVALLRAIVTLCNRN
jgi:hypothetical protein